MISNKYKKILESYTREKIAFYILLGTFLILGTIYGMFQNQIMVNISSVSKINNDIAFMNSDVGEMEFDYMNYKNTLTLEYAKNIGFTEAKKISYITKVKTDTRLTLRD